jgi:hypothetical protein
MGLGWRDLLGVAFRWRGWATRAVPPTGPGLEYTLLASRAHFEASGDAMEFAISGSPAEYELPSGRVQYALPTSRMHFEISKGN